MSARGYALHSVCPQLSFFSSDSSPYLYILYHQTVSCNHQDMYSGRNPVYSHTNLGTDDLSYPTPNIHPHLWKNKLRDNFHLVRTIYSGTRISADTIALWKRILFDIDIVSFPVRYVCWITFASPDYVFSPQCNFQNHSTPHQSIFYYVILSIAMNEYIYEY